MLAVSRSMSRKNIGIIAVKPIRQLYTSTENKLISDKKILRRYVTFTGLVFNCNYQICSWVATG